MNAARPKRMKVLGKVALLAALAAGVVSAAVPWPVDRDAVGRAVVAEVGRASGLVVTIGGPITLKLLPRPRLQMSQLSARASDGALLIDAPEARAELDILSLLRGEWRLAAATLIEPTVTVDLDRLPAALPSGSGQRPWPMALRVRSGVLRTVSTDPAADLIMTGIDASATWPSGTDALVVSGTLAWRGLPAQFAGHVDHLSGLAVANGSSAALQITSPILTLTADGVLSGGSRRRFSGRVAAIAPSLPKLLLLPVRADRGNAGRVRLEGEVVASTRGLSFSEASFRLNRGRFEGTLAIHRDESRTTVEGTLATDLLDVDDLLAQDAGEGDLASLYRRPLYAGAFDADVDLRISATRARVGHLTFDDAALAVLLRDRRFELSLDEAGLFGGRLKGRAIAELGPAEARAHGEIAATGVDLAALTEALGNEGHLGGKLTGEAVLDGTGRNLREVVELLDGRGHVKVKDGRLAGLALDRSLRRFGSRVGLLNPRGAQATVFDTALWDFSIENGVLRIPAGTLVAPGVAMSFSGESRLPNGPVDLKGVAVQTDAAGALLSGSPRLPFTMRGSWDDSVVLVGHPPGGGLPSLVLPLVGGARASP